MMECTIKREDLLEALQSTVGVVEARQTVPILSHVLLDISNDAMTAQCTDNEIAIVSHTKPIAVAKSGTTTVSAYTLLEIVRRLPAMASILLKQEENQLLVQSGSSHFRLMSLSPDAFPNMVPEMDRNFILVSEKALYQAIKTTHFSMAQNNPRYYLNGMLWNIQKDTFQVVATDAHRLAQRSIQIESVHQASLIIPRKTIIELTKLLNEHSEKKVNIGFTEHQLCITGETYQLTSRLIGGTFPDYKKLLPQSVTRYAIVDRDLLRGALSKLGPLLKQEMHKGVRLDFSKNFLKLRVSNTKHETGEESLSVQYDATQGESFSIAFNIEYLDKILDVMISGDIQLTLPEAEGVTVLEQYNPTTSFKDHFYLIMPILL